MSTTMDFLKSLVVIANEKNIKIKTSNNTTSYPTDIISSAIPKFSPCFLRGLLDVHHGNQAAVKQALIQMVEEGFLLFPESVVRGLTSLATGEVDSIEDVATLLKFDADVAEGLCTNMYFCGIFWGPMRYEVTYTKLLFPFFLFFYTKLLLAFVAASVTIDLDHKALNSSSSLNKLCDKLGVQHSVIAALLAIVNQDYEASAGKSKQNRTCPVLKLNFYFLLPSFFSSFLL